MDLKPDEVRDRYTTVRLTQTEFDQVTAIAKHHGCKKSKIFYRAIKNAIAEFVKKEATR